MGRWRGGGRDHVPGHRRDGVRPGRRVRPRPGGPRTCATRRRAGAGASGPGHRSRRGQWPERDPDVLDAAAQDATVWSTETGYWRVSTDRPEGLDDDRHPLEVLLADPAGRVSVYLGAVGNGRVDLASDLIARTGTAAEISASKRLFGLVEGQLLWVWELAAFGEPLQSYASAKLSRRPAA
nr:FABP family protein [Cellulosimicrobium sp. CUA-896]